jgi:hypothetical protein
VLGTLAVLEFGEGNAERARDLLEEARESAEQAGQIRELMMVELNAAFVDVALGDLGAAATKLASARAAVEQVGAERFRASVLIGEASLQARRGEREAALATWARAEAARREVGVDWDFDERYLIDTVLAPLEAP